MSNLEKYLNKLIDDGMARNIAVKIGQNDKVIAEKYKSKDKKIDCTTLFDMASVTKIIVTTTLSYIAIDRGLITPQTKVSDFFDCPADKEKLTIEHLLTHTMGIGHKSLNKDGYNYDNIAEKILSIPCDIEIGSDVLYSCPGFILLGKILEKVLGDRIDKLFDQLVARPLGMINSGFCPKETLNIVNSDKTTDTINIVNDYNCRYLGGVAGNAGLFSNIDDLTKYINMLQRKGSPLYSERTFNEGIKNHTNGMSSSRAYGFVYVDEKYKRTGKLFSDGQIGHGGHTGQSLFFDTKSGLYVIVLSDLTLNSGYDNGTVVCIENIHNAIKKDIEGFI